MELETVLITIGVLLVVVGALIVAAGVFYGG